MLNYIWLGMITFGVVVAALLGQLEGENGIVEGTFDMVKIGVMNIALPLSAIMMLWLGIMRLAEKSGMVLVLSRAIRPVMKRLFPDVPEDHPAMSSMIMNMAANMLGLGNAATPLGLKAMQHLEELNPQKGTATNAMCTFLAINTSSVTLIPATAIGLLAAQGIAQPHAIVGTAIGATLCSTLVAIIAVKLFERMPAFRMPTEPKTASVNELENDSEAESDEKEDEESASRPLTPGRKAVVAGILVLFAGIVALELWPEQRVALQKQLGLFEIAQQLDAERASLDEAPPAEKPAFWLRGVMAVSVVAIPFVLFFFASFAALKRIRVYEEFVEGAKEGFQVAVRIMPFLVAMLTALAIFRSSGALLLIQNLLQPLLDFLRFPAELVPMALMRPLSGSGSQGVLVDILTNPGISDAIKYTAATMFGSTETTFYVLADYFGSVGIRRARHALAAGLCADLAGVIAAVVICRAVFGA